MRKMGRIGTMVGSAAGVSLLALSAAALAEDGAPVQKFDAVTTLGTKTETEYFQFLGSGSIVTRDQIETRVPSSLDDILRTLPNVQADGGPRSSAEEFNIRGLGNQRIVIRVDGARSNFQSGHRGRTFLDPDILKTVSVVRGPSTLYGSGAIGGVLGLELIDAFDFLEPNEFAGFRTKVGYQTVNREWFQGYTGAAKYENFGFLGNFAKRRSADLKAGPPDGIDRRDQVPFSAEDILSGAAKLSYEPWQNHRFFYTFQIFNNDHTIPTAANTDTTALIAARQTRETRHVGGYNYKSSSSGWFDLTARLYYNKVDIEETVVSAGTSSGRFDTTKLGTTGIDLYNTSRFDLSPGIAKVAFTYGFEYFQDKQEGSRNGGPRDQFPEATQSTFGPYGQVELKFFDQVTLLGALRWDTISLDRQGGGSTTESEYSKSFAVGWRPFPWLQLYGKYAEAFRAPALTELFAGGVHFTIPGVGSNVFLTNPNLRPEKAENKELGAAVNFRDVLWKGDRLGAKTSFFRNDVTDLIELEVINNIVFIPPFGPLVCNCTSQSVNINNAKLTGFETEFTYISKWLFGGVAYGQTRGRNQNTGHSIRSIPADKWVITAGSRIPDLDLLFGWRTTIVDDQNRIPGPPDGTQDTGGYETHDVFLSWTPSGEKFGILKGLRVDFGVDNLANVRFRKHLSELPEAGRNYKVSLSYTVKLGDTK